MTNKSKRTIKEVFTVESTTRFIDGLETYVNEMNIYTRRNDRYPFDAVAGQFISKCFALSRSAIVLIQAGYPDEGFGLCRSLYEASVYLRYITCDPLQKEKRAIDYLKFGVTSKAFWFDLIMQDKPSDTLRADIENYMNENDIPNEPKRVTQPWSGRRKLIEQFSKYDHPTDSPASTEILRLKDKAISYTDTSAYVHCTQPGLNTYWFGPMEAIRIRRSKSDQVDTTSKTCLIIHTHLRAVVRYCLFGMGIASADDLKNRNHPAFDINT